MMDSQRRKEVGEILYSLFRGELIPCNVNGQEGTAAFWAKDAQIAQAGIIVEKVCEAELTRMEQALSNLVTKLDVILPKVDGMCGFMAIHGMPYDGPNLAEELKAAKELLRR